MTQPTLDELHDAINRLAPTATVWLADQLAAVAENSGAIIRPFAAAGRHTGHELLDPVTRYGWTADDCARVLLLTQCGQDVWQHVDGLYQFGDSNERKGVLRSLPYLPPPAEANTSTSVGLPMVVQALAANEPALIVAALNQYAFDQLDAKQLDHAILKCVFSDIPLSEVDGLTSHTTSTMVQMLSQLALERVMAGREIATEVWPLIALFPLGDEIAQIRGELQSPVEARQKAASRAISDLDAAMQKE